MLKIPAIVVKIITNIFGIIMDEFEQMYQEEVENIDNVPIEVESTKEYQIRDAQARYRLMANIIQIYFSEKHGEKIITETFKKVDPVDIEFNLN